MKALFHASAVPLIVENSSDTIAGCLNFKVLLKFVAMKKLLFIAVAVSWSFLSFAQPPAGDANKGDYYGAKVKPKGALALDDVAKKLEGGTQFPEVKIKAKIAEVCPKKGCWLKLDLANGEQAMVNMKDYSFFVPVAAIGKTVVIEGEALLKTVSVDELKHYAEDAKKSQAEIDAIKEPRKEVKIIAKGIVIAE
jgi:hypothetical protein